MSPWKLSALRELGGTQRYNFTTEPPRDSVLWGVV